MASVALNQGQLPTWENPINLENAGNHADTDGHPFQHGSGRGRGRANPSAESAFIRKTKGSKSHSN